VSKHDNEPWKQDACVMPGSLIWARHATAVRDWAKGSTSHGNPKVVGEMPVGMAITNADGSLTTEATDFLALLQAISGLEAPAGIRPAGSKTDYMVNSSRAWEVWERLALNGEKAAARVYLGTDGVLGSVGGAPGVDIATLFGVATTIVQGDLGAISRAIKTGVIDPWAAMNFGDSALAPTRRYLMPDPDEDAQRSSYAVRASAFHADVKAHRDNGLLVDDALIAELARRYGVHAAPLRPAAPAVPAATSVPALKLAP